MSSNALSFHEDHLKRKAQNLQLALTRAVNNHDGSSPLYLHQEIDFTGHFEPETRVGLSLVAEVAKQDPIAAVMVMLSNLDSDNANEFLKSLTQGGVSAALISQTFGPTNLPGNLADVIEAALKSRFTKKMGDELKIILDSGRSRTVKLGNGVELKVVGLNRNKTLKKHAEVMLRIRQPNAKQITILEKAQFEKISKYLSVKSLGKDAFKHDKVLSLSRQVSDQVWELRRMQGSPWLGSAKVAGVLGFGPTLIDDFLNNYNHHARLDQKFNYKQFAVDSVTNQTGNALAMVGGSIGGVAIGIIFTGTTLAGAPLVIVGMTAGILVSFAYDKLGLKDAVEARAKQFFN